MSQLSENLHDVEAKKLCDVLAMHVGEALAEERLERQGKGERLLTTQAETVLARQISVMECARLSASRRQEGLPMLTDSEEEALITRAIDQVLGMGLFQPMKRCKPPCF